jgi:hypothetical protein
LLTLNSTRAQQRRQQKKHRQEPLNSACPDCAVASISAPTSSTSSLGANKFPGTTSVYFHVHSSHVWELRDWGIDMAHVDVVSEAERRESGITKVIDCLLHRSRKVTTKVSRNPVESGIHDVDIVKWPSNSYLCQRSAPCRVDQLRIFDATTRSHIFQKMRNRDLTSMSLMVLRDRSVFFSAIEALVDFCSSRCSPPAVSCDQRRG